MSSKEIFFKEGIELNEQQVNDLVSTLTKGCRENTKRRIRSLVTYDLDTLIRFVTWFNRFYVNVADGKIFYCAGQSYPCEIKAIRKEMMRKFP